MDLRYKIHIIKTDLDIIEKNMIHYLILAHKNPKQLEFLIERLYSPYNKIYIHLDKKADIEKYIHLNNKAQFIKRRVSINRGGFSMIEATLNAYKEIFSQMKEEDHVILMSGQDLPIKSQEEIQQFLRKQQNKSLIDYHENRDNKFNNKKGITDYYFNDFIIPRRIDKILEKIAILVGKKEQVRGRRRQVFGGILCKIFSFLPKKTYIIRNYKLYGGSQRHILCYKHIQYILSMIETQEGRIFFREFKYTNCPDERFFQIALLNSKHKNEIENKLLRYVRRTEGSRSPDILSTNDINILRTSEKLFARKFDTQVDKSAFYKIDIISEHKKKEAILMLSDKATSETISKFDKIKNSATEIRKSTLLFHQKNERLEEIIETIPNFIFTDTILNELGYNAIRKNLLPGSNHFPLIKFYREHPEYTYYRNIEDDVCFQGERKYLFDYFKDSKSDFISCHIEEYHDNPTRYRWKTLKYKNKIWCKEKRIKSFNPIYRISNEALAFIDEKLKTGWEGHHEVLMPTLLYNNGYTISDFGGTGRFVPADQKNKFYTKKSMTHIPIQLGNVKNRLYHPIKN